MLTTPDHDDAVTSPPAMAPVGPRPKGFYQDCDPPTGRAGTVYRAEDFNELILNVRALLDAAGVAGTKGLATMLQQSLHRLYAGKGRSVSASVTLSPDDAGLILIDGTSVDVTLTLPAASALPNGELVYVFVRTDTSTHKVRVVPAAGNSIRGGVLALTDVGAVTIRADGVATWYRLTGQQTISQLTTINVAPTGSANPVDPFGGDAFATLQQAINFLFRYRFTNTVTISIAAGTYPSTAPIDIAHPDGRLLVIQGAGIGQTILTFTACAGLQIWQTLNVLRGVEIAGNNAGTNLMGLYLKTGLAVLENCRVRNFSGHGIILDPGTSLVINGTVDSNANGQAGWQIVGATVTGSNITAADNASPTGNIVVLNSYVSLTAIAATNGNRGLYVYGAGACVLAPTINSTGGAAANDGTMVWARDGAVVASPSTTAVGTWAASRPSVFQTFRAERNALIAAEQTLVAGCRALTSPAVNTVGNIQSYVQAV